MTDTAPIQITDFVRVPFRMQSNLMSTTQVEQQFGVSFEKCPFCFHPYPQVAKIGPSRDPTFQVVCSFCGTEGPHGHSPAHAVALWNNRVDPGRPNINKRRYLIKD